MLDSTATLTEVWTSKKGFKTARDKNNKVGKKKKKKKDFSHFQDVFNWGDKITFLRLEPYGKKKRRKKKKGSHLGWQNWLECSS